jgi:hypothetical protein
MKQTFSPMTERERAWIEQQLEVSRSFVAAMSPFDGGNPATAEALDRAWAA